MDYFYDQQLRRYFLQVTRLFGGFVVLTGKGGRNKTIQTRQVPVRYGETSRMVNHIIRLNTENKILSTPFMSTYLTTINMASDRRQVPSLVTTHQVDEREFDKNTGEYTNKVGDRFTVQRHMPVPYNLTFKLDIWTSNINEKMQLVEQILALFNPAVDLQTSDSPLDWTAITYAEMQDSIEWTSKTVPYGTDVTIDVSSMQFLVPAWINPPAKVTQRKVIQTIIQNIYAVKDLPDEGQLTYEDDGDLLTSIIITPGNHQISINGDNEILLLSDIGNVLSEETGNPFSWSELLIPYGDYIEGESSINIRHNFGDSSGITGTFLFDENRPNVLLWSPNQDELFLDTLNSVDAIIDPSKNSPGDGTLAPSQSGQRYLIGDNIPNQTVGWGSITGAEVNDIIEFNGSDWEISFNSSEETDVHIVTSIMTGKQFRWDGGEWIPTIERKYLPGAWRVKL